MICLKWLGKLENPKLEHSNAIEIDPQSALDKYYLRMQEAAALNKLDR